MKKDNEIQTPIQAVARTIVLKWAFTFSIYAGSAFLIAAIVFFFVLSFNQDKTIFYYLAASGSTIGFGLMTMAFSINAVIKKSIETNNVKAEKIENILTRFNTAMSKTEWIMLLCLANDISEKVSIDFSSTLSKSKSDYALDVVKAIDKELASSSVDFFTFFSQMVQPVYKAIIGKSSTSPIDVTTKLNWALGEMEPVCYAYVNDEFEEEIFKQNIREEYVPLYTLYIIVEHYGLFQRQTNFIELALFEAQ